MSFRLPSAPSLLPVLALSACVATHEEVRTLSDAVHESTTTVLVANTSGRPSPENTPASPVCTTSGWIIMDQIFNEDGTFQPTHAVRDIDDLMNPTDLPAPTDDDEGISDLDGPFEILLAPESQVQFTGITMPAGTFYMVPPNRTEEVRTESTAYELVLNKPNTDAATGNSSNTSDQIGDHFWIDASVAAARCPAYYQEHQPSKE